MLFGLSNVPASFQGYINKILAEKLDIFVIVYLDDIFIYTKNLSQGYIDAVRWVLKVSRKYGLYANLMKCWFYKNEVRFLGYIVLAQEVRIEEERIEIIRIWSKPKSVRDIQVFIGFVNFYWRFIQGFSRIAASLTSMLKTSTNQLDTIADGLDGNTAESNAKSAKPKSRKSPKSRNPDNNGATEELSSWLLKLKKPLTTYNKPLPRLWSSEILIRNIISGLRPMHQAML